MIFTPSEFFSSHLCNMMGLERYEPNKWCKCAKEEWRFIHCDLGWKLLQCPEKFKNCCEGRANEIFILVEEPHVAIDGG